MLREHQFSYSSMCKRLVPWCCSCLSYCSVYDITQTLIRFVGKSVFESHSWAFSYFEVIRNIRRFTRFKVNKSTHFKSSRPFYIPSHCSLLSLSLFPLLFSANRFLRTCRMYSRLEIPIPHIGHCFILSPSSSIYDRHSSAYVL